MIEKALNFAYRAHEGQKRKDGTPFILHPIAVAMELARNGADEALICAGLLHDTVEDTNVTEDTLRENFPTAVTELVVTDSEDKSLSWEARKEAVIRSLRQTDNMSYRMLMCADKLCNLRSIEKQLALQGERVWDAFHRGAKQQEWFYRSLASALAPLAGKAMYSDFTETVDRVFPNREE